MKVLIVGDIVGSPGRQAFARVATGMRSAGKVDFVVANAENAAGGKGLSGKTAEELFAGGADVITLGDHAWDQRDMLTYIEREERLVRPLNFAPEAPGRGVTTVKSASGVSVSVISIIGRTFMRPYDSPFHAIDGLLNGRNALGPVIIVDFHAEATSEKIVMGRYLDGRASAVVGTHTHVQTSDERVLPKGTGYITDLGMTGPKDSAIGCDLESVMQTMIKGLPAKFDVARDDVTLEGVVVDIDERTGRARKIKRIREQLGK